MFFYIILVIVSGFLILKMIFKDLDKQIILNLNKKVLSCMEVFLNNSVKLVSKIFLYLRYGLMAFLKFVRERQVEKRNGTSLYWQDVTSHKKQIK